MPSDNLSLFAEHVRNAPSDEHAERVVRLMIGNVATNCPMGLLLQLAQCVIDYRKTELRGEAELN
jgi:hypothetical protein